MSQKRLQNKKRPKKVNCEILKETQDVADDYAEDAGYRCLVQVTTRFGSDTAHVGCGKVISAIYARFSLTPIVPWCNEVLIEKANVAK